MKYFDFVSRFTWLYFYAPKSTHLINEIATVKIISKNIALLNRCYTQLSVSIK